jgi:hypothetical protein
MERNGGEGAAAKTSYYSRPIHTHIITSKHNTKTNTQSSCLFNATFLSGIRNMGADVDIDLNLCLTLEEHHPPPRNIDAYAS